jgi:MFS family permease
MSADGSKSSMTLQTNVDAVTDSSEPTRVGTILWRFGPMIYGPTVLFSLGEGALIPLLPIISTRLGASVATSAAIAAMLVVGQLCGNIPAGWAVARIGERRSMAIGGGAAILGVIGLVLSPNLVVMTISVFVLGFCAAIFALARQAFMTVRVPLSFRARALSLLGGSFRFGTFVGPFISAALLGLFGTEDATIWFALGCLVVVVLLVAFGADPERAAGAAFDSASAQERLAVADSLGDDIDAHDDAAAAQIAREDSGEVVSGPIRVPPGRPKVRSVMWQYRAVLSRLGLAAASLSAVRAARQVVLPLWGVSIGLDAQTIALVVGVSGAIDFALFYVSGIVMDRFGRLWAALPAMILMGVGFLALAFTHDLPLAEMWFALFAAVLGVGNGLSSGILLTIGADIAPKTDPAPFLGSYRTLTDAGGAVAPLIFSGIVAISTLGVATGAMGVLGLLGAVGFIRWLPRFVPRSTTPDGTGV